VSETWPLTVRGHRLKVFKNIVVRKLFRPNREEAAGDWRKLHNEGCMTCICYEIFR
jgi:hypothetical protein